MLDKKSIILLRALKKLSQGTSYKVTTSDEILSCLTQKSLFDSDSIKQIIEFLEKQEYLNIKFSEENTYCYSLLPKANIVLEQENIKPKSKKTSANIINYLLIALSSFVGSLIALFVFFYITF